MVTEKPNAVEVTLTSGVDLRLRKVGDSLLGIGEVRMGGLPLRNPDAPPIAPLVQTDAGAAYRDCRYLGADVDAETVTVHSALVRGDGSSGALSGRSPAKRTGACSTRGRCAAPMTRCSR
jgi:hypothetical protein